MRHRSKTALTGLAAGVAYGLFARLAFGLDWKMGGQDILDSARRRMENPAGFRVRRVAGSIQRSG